MRVSRLILILIIGFLIFSNEGASSSQDLFKFIPKSNLTLSQAKQFESIEKFSYVIYPRLTIIPYDLELSEKLSLLINLDHRKSFIAIRTEVNSWSENEFSWIGKPEGEEETGEYVILEMTSIGLTGTIWYNSTLYSISPLDKKFYVLYQVDQSQFPPENPDDCLCNEINTSLETFIPDTNLSSPSSQTITTSSIIIYDLLVAYTPAAKNAAGDINALINNAKNQTNQVYSNSQTTVRANLVYKMQVSYTESSMAIDLARLINPSDGYMDNVHTYRNQYGADIVVLILGSGGECGQAGAIKAEAWNAFSVVRWNCATQRYTFAHEIGHLFGSEHELGFDDNDYVPYQYNHGVNHSVPAFQTIMAIKGETSIPRIPYLSTPNTQGYYNGGYYTIGSIEWEDNTRVHNERAQTVANFRTLFTVIITGPTRLDPGNVGTFTANPSGGSGSYTNYQWWYRNDEEIIEEKLVNTVVPLAPPPGTWIYLSQYTGYKTIPYGPSFNFSLKCKVTDSNGNSAEDIHSVIVAYLPKNIGKKIETMSISPVPRQIGLFGNYPNPFNSVTTISFGLPESEVVKLVIYSISGQKVKELLDSRLSAGYYQVQWKATDDYGQPLATGLYIYELEAGSKRIIKKMLYVK